MTRRVLMTVDAVGGVWTYALDLARALTARGTAITLACMGPVPSSDQRREAERIAGVSLVSGPYRLEWMDDPWADVDAAGAWLLALERELQPDVVHLNGYVHAALPWRAPVMVVGHSCVRSWWHAVHGTDAPEEWNHYASRVASGLRKAAVVVAPSATMLGSLRELYGPLADARVIPNGCDVDARTKVRAADLYGPRKEHLVFSAGRLWDAAKNIATLCAAAPDVSWPIYVAGDARLDGENRAPDDAAANVTWLGKLSRTETAAWMSRASIYALPARYEPFGLSVLEAAVAGCALVLGDIPSLREIWDDAAIFVPPGDRGALARAIERIAGDTYERAALAGKALARASSLTAERMAVAYDELYRELTGELRPLLSLGAV